MGRAPAVKYRARRHPDGGAVTASVLAACLGLVVGAAIGVVAMLALQRPKLANARQAAAQLRAQLDSAGAAQVQLAELRTQMSSLRHDLRGILSPALLIADRLSGSDDPAIRRAGDVISRTVDRAANRLAESRPAAASVQGDANIAQP